MTGTTRPIIHVRSAFISDIHLGSRECRADLLLDFLRHVQMEQLFLVGDIVDVWSLRRSFYWPQIHNDVCALFSARPSTARGSFTCPAITTSSCAKSAAPVSATSKSIASTYTRPCAT